MGALAKKCFKIWEENGGKVSPDKLWLKATGSKYNGDFMPLLVKVYKEMGDKTLLSLNMKLKNAQLEDGCLREFSNKGDALWQIAAAIERR